MERNRRSHLLTILKHDRVNFTSFVARSLPVSPPQPVLEIHLMRRVGNEFRLEKPPRYEYADQVKGVTVPFFSFFSSLPLPFQIDISRRSRLRPRLTRPFITFA